MTNATWDVGVGWEPRFSELLLQPVHGGEKGTVKHVPLAAVMRRFGIRVNELQVAERDTERINLTATEASICEDAIPADCSGLSVLDIGGYEGRYARLCLERGARSAICVDNGQWKRYGWAPPTRLAGVEYVNTDFMAIRGQFDLVLFFNVAYHLQNPWPAFEHLRFLTKQLAVCSLVTQDDRDTWRICAPYEVNPEDDTVYWVPSEGGLCKLLHNVGFSHVEPVGKAGDRLAVVCE